jgi:hypothetical protein
VLPQPLDARPRIRGVAVDRQDELAARRGNPGPQRFTIAGLGADDDFVADVERREDLGDLWNELDLITRGGNDDGEMNARNLSTAFPR